MRMYCTLPILGTSLLLAQVAGGIQIEVVTHSNNPEELLKMCQGDCDNDSHCAEGLYCFQRDSNERVPRPCEGGEADNSRTDYCVPDFFPDSPAFAPTNQVPVPIGRTPTYVAPVAFAFKPVQLPAFPALENFGSSPPASRLPLGRCQGDCDNDMECGPGLFCFQRDSNSPVPGCAGGSSDNSRTDYCVPKAGFPRYPLPRPLPSLIPTPSPVPNSNPLPNLVSFGSNPPSFRLPLQVCQGDCDRDDDCDTGLYCFYREKREPVPQCAGGEFDNSRTDYCVPMVPPLPTSSPTISTFSPSLFQVEDPTDAPTSSPLADPTDTPTLPPVSDPTDTPTLSPFVDPTDTPTLTPVADPTNPPSLPPVDVPTVPPMVAPLPVLVSYGGDPPPSVLPLSLCEGDCDSDDDCEVGLICYHKDSFAEVPGCVGGLTDESRQDYCVHPDTPAVETYTPGKLTVQKLGLLLSEGLDARIIATAGERVRYHDGRESMESFHLNPDAGATFRDEREGNEGGWIYVSNSEVNNAEGGVGAITFDKDGNILDYKMLLKRSSMNCGGGRTPFGTWVSCEEVDAEGQLYQVDPTGQRAPQVLTLGKDGGRFESFAYDIRNRMSPHFFVTEDHEEGCLRRFTPSNPDWEEDPWSMLHGDGKVEYLFLYPNDSGEFGNYEWIDDLSRARSNAQKYYRFTEGIDVNDSELFFVCKESKHMFILDLDGGTYTRKSTVQGLFDGAPDQIERVLEGSSEFLYFTEEGGKDAGVHARSADGHFFTIFESPVYEDETTGLSWSPDGRIMYVAYQFTGYLFSVWRRDGEPFHQAQLDVKFHHQS